MCRFGSKARSADGSRRPRLGQGDHPKVLVADQASVTIPSFNFPFSIKPKKGAGTGRRGDPGRRSHQKADGDNITVDFDNGGRAGRPRHDVLKLIEKGKQETFTGRDWQRAQALTGGRVQSGYATRLEFVGSQSSPLTAVPEIYRRSVPAVFSLLPPQIHFAVVTVLVTEPACSSLLRE